MKKFLWCFLIVPVLAGCSVDLGTPLVSGEVVTFKNRQEVSREALLPNQLSAVTRWFERHQSGWHGMITEASSEPTQLHLSLKHADGKAIFVSVVVRTNGERYLLLSSSDKWAYQSFGGMFKSWAATRSLSDQEFTTLQNLLSRTG